MTLPRTYHTWGSKWQTRERGSLFAKLVPSHHFPVYSRFHNRGSPRSKFKIPTFVCTFACFTQYSRVCFSKVKLFVAGSGCMRAVRMRRKSSFLLLLISISMANGEFNFLNCLYNPMKKSNSTNSRPNWIQPKPGSGKDLRASVSCLQCHSVERNRLDNAGKSGQSRSVLRLWVSGLSIAICLRWLSQQEHYWHYRRPQQQRAGHG